MPYQKLSNMLEGQSLAGVCQKSWLNFIILITCNGTPIYNIEVTSLKTHASPPRHIGEVLAEAKTWRSGQTVIIFFSTRSALATLRFSEFYLQSCFKLGELFVWGSGDLCSLAALLQRPLVHRQCLRRLSDEDLGLSLKVRTLKEFHAHFY